FHNDGRLDPIRGGGLYGPAPRAASRQDQAAPCPPSSCSEEAGILQGGTSGQTKDPAMASRFTTDCEGFARRDFLKIGCAGVFGLTLPQLLKLEAQARASEPQGARSERRANSVILVWLAGGPATIDMWDLRPNAPDTI